MELFPKSPLALMLGGYFAYIGAAIGDEDSSEDLIMTVEGDPYDIILASAWTIPLKIYLRHSSGRLFISPGFAAGEHDNRPSPFTGTRIYKCNQGR